MRSSLEEIERLFISHWRQTSTPLHIIFTGRGAIATLNAQGTIGTAVVPPLGGRALYLRGGAFEVFVFMEPLESVEYREPGEAPERIRESLLAKYERSVVFTFRGGEVLLLAEIREE